MYVDQRISKPLANHVNIDSLIMNQPMQGFCWQVSCSYSITTRQLFRIKLVETTVCKPKLWIYSLFVFCEGNTSESQGPCVVFVPGSDAVSRKKQVIQDRLVGTKVQKHADVGVAKRVWYLQPHHCLTEQDVVFQSEVPENMVGWDGMGYVLSRKSLLNWVFVYQAPHLGRSEEPGRSSGDTKDHSEPHWGS